MVGDGGQRVITIVTDQHGNLQPAGLGKQFFVTMQGQQSEHKNQKNIYFYIIFLNLLYAKMPCSEITL